MDRAGPLLAWPNWVGVVCRDLPKQRAFYRDVLGLPFLDQGDDWIQFDLGWPNLFELLALDPSIPQYAEPRFQVGFATGNIHAARAELMKHRVQVVSETEGGPEAGGYWSYFRDPEGHVFELSQRFGLPWRPGRSATPQVVGWPVWIGVVVEDLEKERSFYREALGLQELPVQEEKVAFDFGWPHLLEVETQSGPYDRTGYYVSFGVGDIGASGEELLRRGAEPVTDTAGGPEFGGFWRYFKDVEGNVFGISQRLGPPWPSPPTN